MQGSGTAETIKGSSADGADADFITASEASKILKVTYVTLWRMAQRREIQKYKFGTHVRYRRADVLALITPVAA